MLRFSPAMGWFLAAFALYGLTAAPGPLWADSSKLTLYALHHYLPSLNPGDHAGWTLLAIVWRSCTGWLPAPHAFSLLSSFAAAVAVALAFVLGRRPTGRAEDGHALAVTLLVAHPLWWAATVPETYAPAIALTLVVALLATPDATDRRGLWAGLAAGLALATHAFTVALTAPLLLALPRRRWLAAAAGAVAGAAPLWLALFGAPPDPLTGHESGSPATWGWHLGAFVAPGRAAVGGLTLLALLALALGPVGGAGVLRARRHAPPLHPRPRAGAAAALALTVLLCGYAPFRLHLMVLFPLLALLLLAPPVLGPGRRRAQVLVQIALYAAAPALAGLAGHGDLGVRRLPDRRNAWYFLCPVKTFTTGPAHYARALLTAAPPRAVVLADFNPGTVLRLVQESDRLRPDVTIEPTVVDDALASPDPVAALRRRILGAFGEERPVVLADRWEPYYRPGALAAGGLRLVPCGPGLLVEPSGPARPAGGEDVAGTPGTGP